MDLKEMIGSCRTGNPEIMSRWIQICTNSENEKLEWIKNLREQGVVAAHPDDGWVDRNKDRVLLCYPQFDDGVEIGKVIALGWANNYRLVKVQSRHDNMFGQVWWGFVAII